MIHYLKIAGYVLGAMVVNILSFYSMMIACALAALGLAVLSGMGGGIGFGVLAMALFGMMAGKILGTILTPLNFLWLEKLVQTTGLQSMAPTSDRWVWFILSMVIPLALQWGIIGMLLQAMYG
jgi:hypothetical protein